MHQHWRIKITDTLGRRIFKLLKSVDQPEGYTAQASICNTVNIQCTIDTDTLYLIAVPPTPCCNMCVVMAMQGHVHVIRNITYHVMEVNMSNLKKPERVKPSKVSHKNKIK